MTDYYDYDDYDYGYDDYGDGLDDYDEWYDEFEQSFMRECTADNYSSMYDYCECALEELFYEYSLNELENLDPEDAIDFIQYDTDCLEMLDYGYDY